MIYKFLSDDIEDEHFERIISSMKLLINEEDTSEEDIYLFQSKDICVGLKENFTSRTIIDCENNKFWDQVTNKLNSECIFTTYYQHVNIKVNGPFSTIKGKCRRGNCNISVTILENPFTLGLIRVKICLSQKIHKYIVENRLFGEERLLVSRKAQAVGAKVTHLNQFSSNDKKYDLPVIQKASSEISTKNMSELEWFNEIKICIDYQANSSCVFIQSLEIVLFSMVLFTKEQLDYLVTLNKNSCWESPLVISADVSGEIFFKPGNVLNRRENLAGTLTLSVCVTNAVSVMDTMLEHARGVDISVSLMKFWNSYKAEGSMKKIGEVICIDFSWPLINGFLQSIFQTEIEMYLKTKFLDMTIDKEVQEGDTVILIDLLHLTKTFWGRAKKITKNTTKNLTIARQFVIVFVKILICRTLKQVSDLWTSIVKYFGYQTVNQSIIDELTKIANETDETNFDYSKTVEDHEFIKEDEDIVGRKKGIKEKSPFLRYFQDLTAKVNI